MDAQRKQDDPGRDPDTPAWRGPSNRPGELDEDPESDVPDREREATRAEAREAVEETPDYPSGHRGDLGDSGPGED